MNSPMRGLLDWLFHGELPDDARDAELPAALERADQAQQTAIHQMNLAADELARLRVLLADRDNLAHRRQRL